ncbi:rhotekin-like [Pseudoliparis swirei]|uniref:rhotekin-like n=1 Tax=Pseudoliparis swirei TaxID=2059687 RepID=UPI0024BE8CCE|nr:rhotekin-like [Pseudoliparis swirei]
MGSLPYELYDPTFLCEVSVGIWPSEDVEPCLGEISLSDLRIPLMWKDSEYFKNKGELQRCAVFCLLQSGTEIHDTDLVMVDRTLTDICFEGTTILHTRVEAATRLRVELYSSCAVEDFSPGALGPRRASGLGASVGCSSGKTIRAAFEFAAVCGSSGGNTGPGSVSPPRSPDLSARGPKYNLLAHTTLRIEHVREGFKTHDWCLAATEDNPFWLPLYGNMCCRLVAQPRCMMHPIKSGRLEVKLGDDLNGREHVYGVLRGQSLLCYQNQEDQESEDKPLLVIPIKKDTVCMSENDEHQCQWKQCCDQLMKIETQSSRKVIPVKQGSLYHEIVTPSSPGEGLVVPDLSVEIRTLLSSYYKESY